MNQTISPFLTFNGNAEEAMPFYVSALPGAQMRPGDGQVRSEMAAGVGMTDANITTKPVTAENLVDFEDFFEACGCLRTCWCMAWRATKEERKDNTPARRKEYMRRRIETGVPVGRWAYANGEAVAWCSVAPRETHRNLDGDAALQKVWSLTCFYISSAYRRQGLVHLLIRDAKAYAGANGAAWLEAYPMESDSPSYRFMGFVDTFEKEDFAFSHKADSRRHVMACTLKEEGHDRK